MSNRRTCFLLLATVLHIPIVLAAAGEPKPPRAFDARRDGPLDLVEVLRRTATRPGLDGAFLVFERPPKGWVRQADLLELFRLSDSLEPCAHILLITDSRIPDQPSTCGTEARWLIRSYGLHPSRDDVDRWWRSLPTPLAPRP